MAKMYFPKVKSCVAKTEEQSESDREEFGTVPREYRENKKFLKNVSSFCCGGHFVFYFGVFIIDLHSVCVLALDCDSFLIAVAVIANSVLTSHFFYSRPLFGLLLTFHF